MKVSAVHKNARMAPRKIRPVVDSVRGMNAIKAMEQLQFMPGKASDILRDVLKSAMANAVHNHEAKEDSLVVSDAFVDEGIVMKRFQPASRGMAHSIIKRNSHVTVVVDGELKKKDAKKKTKKADIATLSAGEYVDQEVDRQKEEEKEAAGPDHDHDSVGEEDKSVDVQKEKEIGEAHQKSKALQRGGNKQKTHRRKSIG